jgi:BCD family chlorophyll transporter-like MFS transporter
MSGRMARLNARFAGNWRGLPSSFLPFADAASAELPLPRLLRLSLFQVSVGMAAVLLIGTLNRVMIVELGVPAWLVAVMVSLPLIAAPFRAVIGFRSDHHRSLLGWRRVPFLWGGAMLQFGGLAIMPFALILLSGDSHAPPIAGYVAAALAFLLVGAGLHTVQTVGLALATDLAPTESRPRVVALLCMMLLLGMVASALVFGVLLRHFSELRLIQVVQGAGLFSFALNIVALWKQEPRNPSARLPGTARPDFAAAWADFARDGQAIRRLVALGFGTVAFSMQDVLLEPYGGQVLHLTVGQTTALTALLACGGLCGFGLAARLLGRGTDPYRLAGFGAVVGLPAFSCVLFSAPFASVPLFCLGVALVGFGAGLFAHCTLTAAMNTARRGQIGLALGLWGAVQASAAGLAVACGGLLRDGVGLLAHAGRLGPVLDTPASGYGAVYCLELLLMFVTLVAVGPLVRPRPSAGADMFLSNSKLPHSV